MGDAGPGFSPSYSWIGAPSTFNGTNTLTGGDSCKLKSFYLRLPLIRSGNRSPRQLHIANNLDIQALR